MVAINQALPNKSVTTSMRVPRFMRVFTWLLFGYAVLGRTFAGIGYPPIYIGELMLGWGLISAPIGRALPRLLSTVSFQILVVFVVLCGIWLAIDLPRFGIVFTLRDSVIWGYGLFSLVVASYCVRNPDIIKSSLNSYARFAPLYVLVGPIFALLGGYASLQNLTIPGTSLAPFGLKTGDAMVHLSGVMAFTYLGFVRFNVLRTSLLIVGVLVLGSLSRGGFLSFMCGLFVVWLFKPRLGVIAGIIGATFFAVVAFSFFDFQMDMFGRTISTKQVQQNIVSIFSDKNIDLSNTKEWRLEWWNQIIDYTFHGDYFWTGKGFGINLATDDGFQTDLEDRLRSPHSAHMTFLARGGVPVFLLWITLQLSWAYGIVRVIFRARAKKDSSSERIAIFLLTYWTAMIVNMNFDVYLEGPMGGVWFWAIWGYGLALMWLFRHRPESLRQI